MDVLSSDFDSSSDSCSFGDQDDSEHMYGGQACNILSSLEESIGKIDDFLSFERGFVHGDLVCSITDPSGQMGRVSNVEMFADLENVYGTKTKHLNSKKLGKIRSISVGDYVVGGPWVGKVENVVDFVTILFDDGTRCEYNSMGPQKLIPLSPDLLEDSQYPYYPGQRVRVESINKSAGWLCGPRKEKQYEGTVCAIDAGMVYVDWLGCAQVRSEKVAVPPGLQNSKDLTLLSCFSHANWQLGDWCSLSLVDDKGVGEQIRLNASTFGLRQPNGKFERSVAPKVQDMNVIVKTMTKVDVIWQDGSQSFGLDSHSLFPINIVDSHDFWPDQFVVEKGSSDDLHGSDILKWGFVISVDAKERTVRVKWETSAINQETDSKVEVMEEIVSAYELVEHPDFSYCLGDLVFLMFKSQPLEVASQESYKDHMICEGMDEGAVPKDEAFVKEHQNGLFSNSYLSRIGIIMGFKNGKIKVKWATGLTTEVAPYEIFRVDKCEDSSVSPLLHDGNVEEINETERDNSISMVNEGMDLLDSKIDGRDCDKKSADSTLLSFPRVPLGLFSNIAANLFGLIGSSSLQSLSNHAQYYWATSKMPSEIEVLELCNLSTVEQPLEAGDFEIFEDTDSEQIVRETTEKQEDFLLPIGSSKSPEKFLKFDMVNDCSDHHFVNGSGNDLASPPMKRGWLKKVQQEWSILERDLPETIYVRSYEERMDLLRAAIVGAPGTPYHDNLFFFDIFLPPEYPHEPPLVHYHSGGLRLNPNLYESGKVCLSLLNTWTGSGNEVWNPGNSTILQVLLSLQALVLNEKPYFNEAGYDKQIGRAEGEKNSVSYNENAFLVSCKSMLYVISKPPKHFEALVEEHFSECSKYIIQACNAYMEGMPVGCDFKHTKDDQETQTKSSTGFKIMLAKLLPKLVEAFSGNGINCRKCAEAAE